jgi:hypothetical protein
VDRCECYAANRGLLASLRFEFCADHQSPVLDLGDPLALEGFKQIRGKFRIGGCDNGVTGGPQTVRSDRRERTSGWRRELSSAYRA